MIGSGLASATACVYQSAGEQRPDRPPGTVTILLTDQGGSTLRLRMPGELYHDLLTDDHRLLRMVFAAYA
jgi:hypothetical protein